MNALVALIVVFLLALIAWVGAGIGLQTIFTLVLPGLALVIFVLGVIARIVGWSG